MPAWGSEGQRAAAKRLGEYNLANKKFGPEHPNWKGGAWTKEAKAKRRARWEQLVERREAVPKQYPCMLCGVGFTFSVGQRERWYKHGSSVRYSCSHCRGKTLMSEKPPYYYAPAECAKCEAMFTPNENQRVHRHENPDADMFCSNTCLTEFREEMLGRYREQNGVIEGPTHPSWKTGWHSKQAQEARHLVHHIKKYIKEGVNQ